MAQIDSPKEAFAVLRPRCVILTREPSVTNVEALHNYLRTVDDGALQQLQDYVLFPLRFVLKIPGPKQEGLVLAVMDTMTYVLEKTSVRSWESLYSIFSELCLCISSPNDPGKPGRGSEELKLSVLKCLDVLLHAAYGDVVFKLYEPAMLPTLGAAISLILALIEGEQARGVQVAALKCLQALAFQCDCPQDHVIPNQEESYALGNALASFLPGVTRTLSQVICHDMTRGHTVVMRALRVLYKIVSVVMDDGQLVNKETAEVAVALRHHGKLGELNVQRSFDWIKNTSQRLSMVLQKIISCTSAHQHWRVRLELVSLSGYLLAKCSKSLEECTGSFLGALVGAINDEEASVREKSNRVLKEIAVSSQANNCQAFTDLLSENLHGLSSSLPQLMRTADDQQKFFVLNVYLGYLKVLGSQVAVMLNSAVHLKRISKALMQVLEMDVTDVRIVEERSFPIVVQDGSATPITNILKKHFLYFTDDRIYLVLREICQMLGYYGNLHLLVDHFMDLYRESSAYRKQSILVLNEVLAGAVGIDLEGDQKPKPAVSLISVISPVIEEYLSADNWDLPTNYEQSLHSNQDENHGQGPSLTISKSPIEFCLATVGDVRQLNSNIWQICLQLEGIGMFSRVLGPNFHPLLMTVLYSVLEKVGDKSLVVSQSAVGTMSDICQACGYASPNELININADYLLNDISLNLGRPGVQPHAPRVFAAMVTHSDASLLPLVADVVQDVLTSLDLNHDQRALEVCEVLHSVMKAIARLDLSSKKQPNPLEMKTKELLDARGCLLEYRRQVELAEGITISQADQDDQVEDISSVTEDQEESGDSDGIRMDTDLPSHITISKDVMERCIHLLSISSLRLRLKVLDMLKLCVNVMCEYKEHLYPMVHRCWPVLQQRLNDEDPFIVPQAFKVLCSMGEVCTDFLKKRVSKTVMPKITAYLTKQAQTSVKAGLNYTQSLNYKLQLAYLQGLGPLCVSLDLEESDLDMVAEACLPYLSVKQPPRLQEACCSVFQCMITKDPDVIWFTLCERFCPYIYQPPHTDFMPVQLCGMSLQKNEYTDNIMKLLTEFRIEATGRSGFHCT